MEEKPTPRPPQEPPIATEVSPLVDETLPPGDAVDEGELEFRPVVKYAGIAALVLMMLGVEYATYKGGYGKGYHHGYHEAAESGKVRDSVNRAAVENLTHFMQSASADDETLLATVTGRDKALGWIDEASVRDEAEWMLARSAMERGLTFRVTDMTGALLHRAPRSEVWARRGLALARALAAEAHPQEALSYYRYATTLFAELGRADEQLVAMNENAVLLAADTEGSEEALSALDALQQEAATLGEAGTLLRADILAFMGWQYRERGDEEAALRYFEQALSGVDVNEVPALASVSVCYGIALLEKGDAERAEKLLREGINRMGNSPGEVTYLLRALRELARLEQERGALDAALALLYRAEGYAANRVEKQNSFWSCLYDQRGWINLLRESPSAALADFRSALEGSPADELRLMPAEGAGLCCIRLGDAEQAVRYLNEAVELRSRTAAQDNASLARVQMLLGEALDMRDDATAAAEAYARAAALLADAADDESKQSREAALMRQAYVLGQLGQWTESAAIWSDLQALVPENTPRADEVREQLELCRRHGATPAGSVDPDEESDSTEDSDKPSGTRRRRRR